MRVLVQCSKKKRKRPELEEGLGFQSRAEVAAPTDERRLAADEAAGATF